MEIANVFDNAHTWLNYVKQERGQEAVDQVQTILDYCADKSPIALLKGINIAATLLALKLDNETICAAMLYPILQSQDVGLNEILDTFGESYRKLLNDALQMQSLGRLQKMDAKAQSQIENLRKMLLAMVTDVRAVLIILAERLWLLRDAKNVDPKQQALLAQETSAIYAPLANRLGVWQLKWEIEDLCLRYLQPDTYVKIAKWLASKRVEREAYIERCISMLSEMLQSHDIKQFQISGRVKHIYSIYKKMQRKNANFEEIYDISAVRILVPQIDDCYTVLSSLQDKWQQILKEFDDYISRPKPNGYQSIHTVIIGPEDKNLEVQIRTFDMHHESELGVAAHWRYKEGVLHTSNYEAKIALLRQIMEWQKEVASQSATTTEMPQQDIFVDHVYVFTPAGDIIDMPKGATPLDFAYHIHSEVGHRCRGAKVNGKMVPLTYALQTGEKVEILTAKHPKPSRDWLHIPYGYLATARARAKVQHWFRLNDPTEEHEAEEVEKPVKPAPKIKTEPAHTAEQTVAKSPSVQLLGFNNLLTHVAKCCKPLPGNKIIGYITLNRGVSIHRDDCRNMLALTHDKSNRLLSVGWGAQTLTKQVVEIEVGTQSASIRDQITGVLASEKINILSIVERSKSGSETIYILQLEVFNNRELERAFAVLRRIDDITRLIRR